MSAVAVQVAVRLRPVATQDTLEGSSTSWLCLNEGPPPQLSVAGVPSSFPFDAVFTPSLSQSSVFAFVSPLVDSFLEGFNSTVLAYGQTGSGKTHTMMGPQGAVLLPGSEEAGVIPRVAAAVFAALARRSAEAPDYAYSVKAQYLELYNEELRDLLAGGGSSSSSSSSSSGAPGDKALAPCNGGLPIRESEGGGLCVLGARERPCGSVADVLAALEDGGRCRVTAATLMNAHSSRSHAIFTLTLEQRGGGMAGERRASKFHLLDLAGSERVKRTGAQGQRFKESVAINTSLLALGNVISALSEEAARRKGAHIPYRDSKLTRLLQDSLGGNSKTAMLACVSPAEENLEESLNTLRYAARARNITNAPKINRNAGEEGALAALRAEVARLHGLLAQGSGSGSSGSSSAQTPAWWQEIFMGVVEEAEALERLHALPAVEKEAAAVLQMLLGQQPQQQQEEEEAEEARKEVIQRLRSVCALLAGILGSSSEEGSGAGSSSVHGRAFSQALDASLLMGLPQHTGSSSSAGHGLLPRGAPSRAAAEAAAFSHASLPSEEEILAALTDIGFEADGAAPAAAAPAGHEEGAEGAEGAACSLEEEATRQQRWARIEHHLEDMAGGIEAKEKLATALAAKGRELALLSSRYAAQFAIERAAKKALEAEVEALQARVTASEGGVAAAAVVAGGGSSSSSAGDARLREQLEQAQARLRETDARLRDILAAQRLKEKSEQELGRLRGEISTLWRAKEAQQLILRRERAAAAREAAAHKARAAELAHTARRNETAVGVLKGELRVKTAEAEAAQGKVAALMLKLGGAGGGVKARCAAVRAVAASMARVAGGKHRGGGGASGAGGAGMHSSLLTLSALHPVAAAPAAAAATAAAAAAQTSEVEKLRGQLESAAQAMMERERHVEELERRLAGRGDDLRSLQGLMGRRDVLLSKQHHSGAPAQGEAAGAAAAGGSGQGEGLDSALVAEIEAFFATESVATAAAAAASAAAATASQPAAAEREAGGGESSGTLRDVEDAIEAVRARIAVTDGRILEIAAGDEEITAAAAAAAAAGSSSSDAAPASATNEAALPSLQHLLQLPANASPLPALQLLFDMLVTQKTAGRRQAAALGTAQRRVAELEEALEVRSAALTASRLHTDKAVCEARWEALAQAKLLSRLSSGSEREAAQGAGEQLAQAQAQVLPDGEMLALLQSSAQQLMEAQQDAAGKARALEAAHAEISRLREIVASATGSSEGAGAAAAAAQPTTAAAAARPSSRAPSTTSTSSTASVASTASTSARQQAGKGPSTRSSLPVPAQSLSATLTTIANALATTSTTAASSKAAGGGRRGGGAAQQPHQRSDSGVPIVSVGIQELSAPLGRGASGGRLSSAANAASAAAAAAVAAAAASSENAQPPLQASDAAAGEAASLGWWKQRGVSVVGAKFAPPPAALQQASGPQVAAPVLQNLRSQLSAALPFSYGSTTEQARAAAAAAASLGTASGSSSAASSPGSEVLRAHSSLQELASPRRQ